MVAYVTRMGMSYKPMFLLLNDDNSREMMKPGGSDSKGLASNLKVNLTGTIVRIHEYKLIPAGIPHSRPV